ncbi:hypothetical protein EJ05DRAFT_498920 [Pseudovirgaria hyperparasitica]|uniref:Uncharacterized protein n=1 Tax=Pseudovirgaria hyperparasitica TaxID=470096 RepID=A0A6A6WDT1_9PEZI|nr:uncharacterized protein EJ05DRAFT_498920 [Pseudovirgaria hyperparasitica]KAF2759717.1 hypothetical protein EJ05DRAFT_498920 [Pseudovirgaria hyperparasitica]
MPFKRLPLTELYVETEGYDDRNGSLTPLDHPESFAPIPHRSSTSTHHRSSLPGCSSCLNALQSWLHEDGPTTIRRQQISMIVSPQTAGADAYASVEVRSPESHNAVRLVEPPTRGIALQARVGHAQASNFHVLPWCYVSQGGNWSVAKPF